MGSVRGSELRKLAEDCVCGMGDIFWDWQYLNGAKDGYPNPIEVAEESILTTLEKFAAEKGIVIKDD